MSLPPTTPPLSALLLSVVLFQLRHTGLQDRLQFYKCPVAIAFRQDNISHTDGQSLTICKGCFHLKRGTHHSPGLGLQAP